MLCFDVNLNQFQKEPYLCSPTIMVTEDKTDDRCPIILPEAMQVSDAEVVLPILLEAYEKEFTTVAQVSHHLYGKEEDDEE